MASWAEPSFLEEMASRAISTYFLDQDRERFWILGGLGKGFLWHKWKFVNSLILLMHFICKKGKNLEIHPSFGYSWANYEKNKENFGKKCLFLPFWLGKSFWWCRERFHFLGRYIYPCRLYSWLVLFKTSCQMLKVIICYF